MSLLKYESVKEYLSKSLNNLKDNDFENSIINSHIAFKELLYCYEKDKYIGYTSPFKICEDFTFYTSFFMGLKLSDKLDKFIDMTGKSLSNLDDIVKILAFGIDYKKYLKFKILSPYINFFTQEDSTRKYDFMVNPSVKSDERNSKFCFDFVIDCSLKLQNLDFEIDDLLKS